MQMYRVKFAQQMPGGVVELGDCIVCADSQDRARDKVMVTLDLPRSGVEYDVNRIKSNLHQLGRREEQKALTTVNGTAIPDKAASTATFPGVTEGRKDRFWYFVEATAMLRAENENDAIAMLGRAIAREMGGEKQKRSCRDLDIKCERRDSGPRTPAVEQNGLYAVKKFFPGGDTRT